MQQFQECAIWIAVNNALDRAECEIAGRIGHFVWPLVELGHIRNELPGDRIARIGGVYQLRDRAGDANRIDRGDPLDRGLFCIGQETGSDQIGGAAQSRRRLAHLTGEPR